MELSIIIVNYKSRAKLLNCLDSITKADLKNISYEIIVVDNASGDDLSGLSDSYPLRLIMSPKNLGMGGGNNLGINEARGEYILVLNPDTVVNAAAISELLNYLKGNESVGLVGPKLLYPDGSLQYSCATFPGFFMPVLRRTFLGNYFKTSRNHFTMQDFDHNSLREVDWLMGSCLLFRKSWPLPSGEIFRPHFDERYFMYFEDIDLCREIKKQGKRVIYNPTAIIIHDHARESAKHSWYIALFKDKITWIHIFSWFKYFLKWGFK
jgi:hypothetical protein